MNEETGYTIKCEDRYVSEVLYYPLAVEVAERWLELPEVAPGSVTVWYAGAIVWPKNEDSK
jgi:hypothetical protein